jgi:hypothetical protein
MEVIETNSAKNENHSQRRDALRTKPFLAEAELFADPTPDWSLRSNIFLSCAIPLPLFQKSCSRPATPEHIATKWYLPFEICCMA